MTQNSPATHARTASVNSASDRGAPVTSLCNFTGYAPDTPLKVGVERMTDWLREYQSSQRKQA